MSLRGTPSPSGSSGVGSGPIPGAAAAIIQREFFFYGKNAAGPNSISAADLLREVDERRLKGGWDNDQTQRFFLSCLRDGGFEWYDLVHGDNLRSTEGPKSYEEFTKPAFARFFEVNISAAKFRLDEIGKQRPGEEPFRFATRIMKACRQHCAEARETAPQAEIPKVAQTTNDILTTLANNPNTAAMAATMRTDLTNYTRELYEFVDKYCSAAFARHIVAAGFPQNQKKLRDKVDEFNKDASKPSFNASPAAFIEMVNAEASMMTSGRVNAIEDDEERSQVPSDEDDVAAVRPKQNPKPKRAKKKGQPKDKKCGFCERKGHVESECFTKKNLRENVLRKIRDKEEKRPVVAVRKLNANNPGNEDGRW